MAGFPNRYITLSDLQAKVGGRGRSSIYRDIEAGRLPEPIRFGGRLYWREADIDSAMEALAK